MAHTLNQDGDRKGGDIAPVSRVLAFRNRRDLVQLHKRRRPAFPGYRTVRIEGFDIRVVADDGGGGFPCCPAPFRETQTLDTTTAVPANNACISNG